MVKGEVTSRQDGGVHTWVKPEMDATVAGGGMTRSVVRGSYLRLRTRATRLFAENRIMG
jgi:hypothetical protein